MLAHVQGEVSTSKSAKRLRDGSALQLHATAHQTIYMPTQLVLLSVYMHLHPNRLYANRTRHSENLQATAHQHVVSERVTSN